MTKLLDTKIYVQYSQLAILDAEDKSSYPQWETGEELIVFGEKGIIVATENDTKVNTIVSSNFPKTNGNLLGSGIIQVGRKGMLVGNVVTNDLHSIECLSGKTRITIYVDNPGKAQIVEFVIQPED